jgi:glycosyltransferase involved in cell wall biosynthesis
VSGTPLRVLHVIPSMGHGGSERQVVHLSQGLVALGHEVHVALLAGGENLPLLECTGARVYRLAPRGSYDPRSLVELAGIAKRTRPHVIQTWLTLANVLGGLVATRAGVPWVYAERSFPEAYFPSWKIRLERGLAQRWAAAVVSNSATADAYWARRLVAGRPRAVIRNALPLEELGALPAGDPATLGLPADVPLVVYVGRLLPHKGIDTLLEALERVAAERPIAVLLLGVGELHESVRARLRSPVFAGRAVAPGFRYDTAAWLKRAAAFVSLSHFEGMPNTVMEALAMGCPAVVSDIPQHREILEPENGWLVPIGDAAAAADAIRAVVDDPSGAAVRACRARRAVDEWSVDATSRAWAALYARLVQ